MAAERQAIGNRLSPVRWASAPNASVRRSSPSHRPTCRRHVGSASYCVVGVGDGPIAPTKWRRESARLMHEERKPLGRKIETNASFWIGLPAQRSPAVIRRPGPRRAWEFNHNPSASPRLCASAFLDWAGGRLRDSFVPSCLCVCDVGGPGVLVFTVSRQSVARGRRE